MKPNEYQCKCAETVTYRKEIERMYLCAGLISEVGEVAGKFKKFLRDTDGSETAFKEVLVPAMIAETGDVMWYLARLHSMLGLTLQDSFDMIAKLELVPYPVLDRNENILSLIECLADATSSISNCCSYAPTATDLSRKHHATHEYLEDSLGCCVELAKICGVTIEEIMDKNIEKLFSRKERGVLSGSGDNR